MNVVALVVAAGRGARAEGPEPKQYRELAGSALMRYALETVCGHPAIDAVRAVIRGEDRALYDSATQGLPLLPPVAGGPSRQASVRLGLESLANEAPDWVLIHDAARPFVSAELIDRCLAALEQSPAVIPALPLADSLKRLENGTIAGTVDRSGLWRVQTPQCFHYDTIMSAHRAAASRDDLTDDAAVAETSGLAVTVVEGEEENFKVTHPADFTRAERHLAGRARRTAVGMGYDVHAFAPGRPLMLCGIEIPHEQGLAGHSDADVGLHALTDAILGAIGDGDIGEHFPPSDASLANACSERFLRHALSRVRERGGTVANVDVTLICEAPKLAPHRTQMRERIARLLDIDPGCVSVKATTTEGLGFTGRREGIAAQAIAAIDLPR